MAEQLAVPPALASTQPFRDLSSVAWRDPAAAFEGIDRAVLFPDSTLQTIIRTDTVPLHVRTAFLALVDERVYQPHARQVQHYALTTPLDRMTKLAVPDGVLEFTKTYPAAREMKQFYQRFTAWQVAPNDRATYRVACGAALGYLATLHAASIRNK